MTGGLHRLQQSQGRRGVGTEVQLWPLHALARLNQGRKVHHAVEAALAQRALDQGAIGNISLHQTYILRDRSRSAMTEVVVDRHLVASRS